LLPTTSEDDQFQKDCTKSAENRSQEDDGQIVKLVHRALHASGYIQLRQLQVYFEHGRITLQGRLPTYYLKQVAQSLILAVDGVQDIDNDVKVFSCK
jgi:osmotically-inducible protein OsmY